MESSSRACVMNGNKKKENILRVCTNCKYQPLVGLCQTFNLRRAYVRLSTPDIASEPSLDNETASCELRVVSNGV